MSSLPSEATRVYLAERPAPNITESTFKSEKIPIKSLRPNNASQVLVKVDYLSLDPAMRGWLDDRRSYIPPVGIGETMRANGLGTVVEVHPENTKLKVGDVVKGTYGWSDYRLMETKDLQKIKVGDGVEALDYMGPLGLTGLTAYFGMLDIGKIKPGEVCVVSGAAGAVGSMACQIAKIKGAKVIAIAGGPDKCKYLEQELGVDKALDYKSSSFVEDFKTHVGYLDVYFDNVGGDILDMCLNRLKKNARIALCGAISDYGKKPKGLTGYMNLISQRALIEGFIVFDYQDRYPEAIAEMGQWMKEGKIKRKFHIEDGLERCPEHLAALFKGVNTGKMLVRVSSTGSSKL